MYKFSENSEAKLQTCHADLQKILRQVIKLTDFIVLEGTRGEEAQNLAYAAGKSRLKFPQSKHNRSPSMAVDIAPYPIDWNNSARFAYLAGMIIATASALNIKLRWGGDWDKDGEIANNNFNDLAHFELT
jgi:peptidoglycan L-alanyl-D-glutamate endopeptidase CwlK